MSLFTLTLFLLFSATTIFIAYSLEDAIFKEQLQLAKLKLESDERLPKNISVIDNSVELQPNSIEQLIYLELSNIDEIGEFKINGKHYHYLATEQGTLLLDTSETKIINRAIDDILTILFIVLIPAMILALWVARVTATHSLKPFHQLTKLFINNKGTVDVKTLEQINEQDVKHIATELWQALDQKSQLLQRQVAFNQGMAHELRTPLQVMTHSTELLGHQFEQLNDVTAFLRLNKSIQRMHRLCNGLLWLTSQQHYLKSNNVLHMLETSLQQLNDLINTHHIAIDIGTSATVNFAVPEEVFELILFNLINNVVHHGSLTDGSIKLQISITDRSIIFTNALNPKVETTNSKDRFGIGLTLISKLTERFELTTKISTDKDNFMLTIANHSKK